MEESISQFDSSSNLITINEEYRDESPEALAHALIWPLASLHAIGERGGPPRSWAECIADRTTAHSAQALWWLGNYLESGKPNPTELEQWANNNSAMYLDKSLSEWVREAYRESCARYGEPPALPTPAPAPNLPVEQYVEGSRDLFGPEEWIGEYLLGRGLDENSMTFVMLRDLLRQQSYPLGSLYLAYLDSLGKYAPEDKQEFRSFFSRYFSDIPFRRDVAGAVREYLESAEYLGPNLTAVLRSRQFSLDQSIHIIGSVGEAMLRATSPKWIADSVSVGRRQGIEGSLRGSFRDKTYAWLETNPIPNPWYEH